MPRDNPTELISTSTSVTTSSPTLPKITTMAQHVFLVSKKDNRISAIGEISKPNQPLPPSAVRVHTSLISLSSNNLTYAAGGSAPPLYWWDTYPVPEHVKIIAPADEQQPQANDIDTFRSQWGIVPAWGYGTVLSSTHPSIKKGSLLWGFWPASDHDVDLTFAETPDQLNSQNLRFREVSHHRQRLMTIYNDYVLEDPPVTRLDDNAAMKVLCRPVWQAGYLLNAFILGNLSGGTPIHPLGVPGFPWTREDGDLSKAVVVSLGAGTKTARSFAWNLSRRQHGGDLPLPYGLVQATSDPSSLSNLGDDLKTHNVNYKQLMDTGLNWAISKHPERLVIADFGASKEITKNLVDAVRNKSKAISICVITIGSECKVYSEEERKFQNETNATVNPVQMNTSGVHDRVVEQLGEGPYRETLEKAYAECISENGMGDLAVHGFQGVEGERGVEGAWGALCGRALGANAGIVVKLD